MNVTKLLTMTTLAITPMSFAVSTTQVQAATMTVGSCQPLSGDNRDDCCAAENWRDLIRSDDVRFCPPLNASDQDSGRMGAEFGAGGTDGGVVDAGGTDGGTDPGPDTTGSIDGNPGNDKEVGGSGEQDKGPAGDPSGTKGGSN